jgi:hypothetical protein
VSGAKRVLEEICEQEAGLWRPMVVRLTADQKAWFAAHPEEREQFRRRRPGEFDALAMKEDLIGVSIVPIGDGLARVHPQPRWRLSDG